MKSKRLILLGGFVLLAIGIFSCLPEFGPDRRAQRKVEETRRSLRQVGFKLDLSEFAGTISPEIRNRSALLVRAGEASPGIPIDRFFLAQGIESAHAIWKEPQLKRVDPFASSIALASPSDSSRSNGVATQPAEDLWLEFRSQFAQKELLDQACEAAIAGPIQFALQFDTPTNVHLNHLAGIRQLSRTLAGRVVMDLHDQRMAGARKNLLATTRLSTAWRPEPAEISHLVRANCLANAYNATWELLQAHGWNDEQLAQLQHEWESLDLWKDLPETASFSRASTTAACRLERHASLSAMGFGQLLQPLFYGLAQGPVSAVEDFANSFSYNRRQSTYLKRGTYEDENVLMLHYRDREDLWKKAITAPTWEIMRGLGVATNELPASSRFPSQTSVTINLRQNSNGLFGGSGGLGGMRRSFSTRIADAEARRTILIAALALSRFELKNGSYPSSLAELTPEFCQKPLIDFMDGKPLRYHAEGGHALLYSVGPDCVDDGGKSTLRERFTAQRPNATIANSDVIWPRAASH